MIHFLQLFGVRNGRCTASPANEARRRGPGCGNPRRQQADCLWCVAKLPTLYAKYRLTYESRYGEEITRLVQGALNDLVNSQTASTETQKLAASISKRLQLLHEQS